MRTVVADETGPRPGSSIPRKAAFISMLAGVLGLAANFPVAVLIPMGVLGFASGLITLLATFGLLRRPAVHVAWGIAIIWFACLFLVSGLFWVLVATRLAAGGGLVIGVGGVSASLLGLWGGKLAVAWRPSEGVS